MKIYIMDTIELPNGSRGDTRKWELTRNLSKMGYEVHVMTYEDTKVEGAVTHTMRAREKYRFDFLFKLTHLVSILRVIMISNPDIIYTRNVSFALLGLLIKKIKNAKLVLELNGLFSEDWKSEKKKLYVGIKNIVWSYLEIFVAKRADAVIAVAQGIRDILIQRGGDRNKIFIIPNGANVDMFRQINDSAAINELRNHHGISENDYIVAFIGNLAPHHGIEYLIKSAPLVLNVLPNTKFLIVGDGAIKKELINLSERIGVSDEIIFTGGVSYEIVPLYINMADVCVAPFIRVRNERIGLSPLKIYEYLACGKPVVASDIKGIGDLLRNSNAGIAVTPEDPVELANAIIKLLKDEKLRELMGKNGRELVINNFNWKHTAKKTIEVFERVLT